MFSFGDFGDQDIIAQGASFPFHIQFIKSTNILGIKRNSSQNGLDEFPCVTSPSQSNPPGATKHKGKWNLNQKRDMIWGIKISHVLPASWGLQDIILDEKLLGPQHEENDDHHQQQGFPPLADQSCAGQTGRMHSYYQTIWRCKWGHQILWHKAP